ncbi:MAG TPA: hypothetical protein VIL30_00405 [Ramlibacter sp.]|jgi:hypothetical protein
MNPMYSLRAGQVAATVLALLTGVAAAQPAPAFDVAYRAWDAVTDIARHNRSPAISGECGKTFRPFVVPGLRAQPRNEQDRAALACHAAARSVCADGALQRTPEMAKKCEEFR